jgi:hypothetical protein
MTATLARTASVKSEAGRVSTPGQDKSNIERVDSMRLSFFLE